MVFYRNMETCSRILEPNDKELNRLLISRGGGRYGLVNGSKTSFGSSFPSDKPFSIRILFEFPPLKFSKFIVMHGKLCSLDGIAKIPNGVAYRFARAAY